MEKINYEKIKAVKVGVQATNIEKGRTSALKTEEDNQGSSGSSEIERKRPKAREFLKGGEKYKEASQLITGVSKTKATMLSSINEFNQSNNLDSSEERLTADVAESNKGESNKPAEIEKSGSEAVVPSLREGDSTECSRKLQTGESTSKDVEQSPKVPESETTNLNVVKRRRGRCQRPPRRIRIAEREKALREALELSENCGSLTIKQDDNSSKNEDPNSDPSVTEEIRSEGSVSLKKKPETVKIPMAIVAPLPKENILHPTSETLKNERSLQTTPLKDESGTVVQTTVKRKRKKSKKNKTGLERNSSTCNTTQPGNKKKQSKKQRAQVVNRRFPNILEMIIRKQRNLLAMQRSYLMSPILTHLQHQVLLGQSKLFSLAQGNLSENRELPMINQGHYSGNSGIPPLLQSNSPAGNKIKRKKPKNRVDSLRNQSLLNSEVYLARYQEYLGDHEKQEYQSRNYSSLLRNDANPPNIQRHQGNLSGSQEYPPQFQTDILARPSTSKIEVDSKDFYDSQECSSSGKRKRFNDSPPRNPIDLKRPKFFEEELIPQDFKLKRIIIAEDFGQTSVGFEELELIRIAMSREIYKIRKGPIPKFISTYLKWFGIIVEFADKWSMDWLTDAICKIHPWSGARLRLMKVPFNECIWKEKFERSNYFV